LAVEPGNTEIQALSDALEGTRAHRLTVGYNFQRFDPDDIDFNAGTVEVNAHVSDGLRVFGTGELLRSRDGDEGRGGGGVEWLAHPMLTVRAGIVAGGTTFLPSADFLGGAEVRSGRARWKGTFRYFDFDGARLWMLGPGLAFDVTPRLTVTGEYLYGSTQVGDASSVASDNFSFGVRLRPSDRVGTFAEYRHGIDRIEWMTADRITATDADTLGVGLSFDLTPFVAVGGSYDYQSRSESETVHRGRAALTVKF
jgi:YaiO family outer membrane protein